MTNNKKFITLTASLLLIQVVAGCKTSEKPFPDNTFEWNPRTEKAFPDNTPGLAFSSEKPLENSEATPHKNSKQEYNQNTPNPHQLTITQPTSFRGVVPCNDCENIELILTLRPDQVFFLRKEFNRLPKRGEERSQELGGWKISDDGKELILKRGNGTPQRLAIINANQLDVLNAEGKSINNNKDYQLNRLDSAMQLIDSAELSGLYFEEGARGYWLECQSGVTWPVARAGEYAQLSKKYNTMDKPSEKTTLLTDITGHLVKRQDDSKTTTEYLVVDNFIQMENRFDCR